MFNNRVNELYDPEKTDVWACGVTFFVMLCGELPFGNEVKQIRGPHSELVTKIRGPHYDKDKVPAEARPLIARMLTRQPGSRPEMREVSMSVETFIFRGSDFADSVSP